ncbi:flagellar biosynthesis protein FlhB [Pararobbsia silviterrae]|uniref:Flagellar biosynthetic protein FlhB n=1 Tax=Pararobbsia silviterrae TaxID=1792498 RepID=A0A494X4U8_9BURK|nr:flagellar biosynthesis protein FlhB [Pararobbsia silviterrae]RKP45372.1 flagellar type III secretion system protein FlhB [Pararobbsia silviterrae]
MAEESDSEKTEPATPRRIEKAREEGQVARSRELSTFALLVTGFGMVYANATNIAMHLKVAMREAFTFDRAFVLAPDRMMPKAMMIISTGATAAAPIIGALYLAAVLSPLALGGWLLTTQPLIPNFARLDPIAGIGKMFSANTVVQLLMSIFKCLVVGGIAVWAVVSSKDQVLQLFSEPLGVAMTEGAQIVCSTIGKIVMSFLLLVLADVPWQLYSFAKKLRMTKEEVKREFKESEGDPHIKGKIRAQQRALARRRMMANVPQADVIVTNPTHFAVALQYSDGAMRAPKVIAKGMDLVAARIREIGAEHNVAMLEAPPLARALFYNVDLNKEIPAALYSAVAEVLAWVFQLRRWKAEGAVGSVAPVAPTELEVPAELDQYGSVA